jgi:FeS assembly ATPase SufC
MLRIEGLTAAVGGTSILRGLDLAIGAGEVHAVMGPNGAGKSTLANVLAGREGYDVAGTVTLDGVDLLGMTPEQRAAAGVFLAFQYPAEIPGVGNMYFLRTALNALRRERRQPEIGAIEFLAMAKEHMARLEMSPALLNRSVNAGFSGGEKKRNEVLQLSLLEPRLVILDETGDLEQHIRRLPIAQPAGDIDDGRADGVAAGERARQARRLAPVLALIEQAENDDRALPVGGVEDARHSREIRRPQRSILVERGVVRALVIRRAALEIQRERADAGRAVVRQPRDERGGVPVGIERHGQDGRPHGAWPIVFEDRVDHAQVQQPAFRGAARIRDAPVDLPALAGDGHARPVRLGAKRPHHRQAAEDEDQRWRSRQELDGHWAGHGNAHPPTRYPTGHVGDAESPQEAAP